MIADINLDHVTTSTQRILFGTAEKVECKTSMYSYSNLKLARLDYAGNLYRTGKENPEVM